MDYQTDHTLTNYQLSIFLNPKMEKCQERANRDLEKKREKLMEQFVKRQDRDFKNFKEKMNQTRSEMLKGRDLELENIEIKFRVQLNSLNLAHRNEQIQKEKFLRNFDPTKGTNIDRIYFKICQDNAEAAEYHTEQE